MVEAGDSGRAVEVTCGRLNPATHKDTVVVVQVGGRLRLDARG